MLKSAVETLKILTKGPLSNSKCNFFKSVYGIIKTPSIICIFYLLIGVYKMFVYFSKRFDSYQFKFFNNRILTPCIFIKIKILT